MLTVDRIGKRTGHAGPVCVCVCLLVLTTGTGPSPRGPSRSSHNYNWVFNYDGIETAVAPGALRCQLRLSPRMQRLLARLRGRERQETVQPRCAAQIHVLNTAEHTTDT